MDKLRRVAAVIDAIEEATGRIVRWFLLAVALFGCVVAALRYLFGMGAVWLQELQLWLHASLFMLALGWTLRQDGHVRLDIIYRTASRRWQAGVDFLGSLLLLVPASLALMWLSLPYVAASWRMLEASREAGGLPALFLLKTVIPIAFLLLAIAGVATAIQAWLQWADQAAGGREQQR